MILILYATYTGYTREVAGLLCHNLTKAFPGVKFALMNARDMDPSKFQNYRLVLFGASTWDDGLNPDTKDFLKRLERIELNGQSFALFGLGDRQFLVFCAALPIIEAKLKSLGANVLSPAFTFDNYQSGQDINQFIDWAKNIVTEFS
jgi:flavodoxin I